MENKDKNAPMPVHDDKIFKDMTSAWLMIQVTGQTSINFLNRKKLSKEMAQNLHVFGLSENGCENEDKLRAFSEYFISSCMDSRAYKTTLFGTVPMSEAGAASRLAEDINEVTRIIPKKLGLENVSAPLRDALYSAFSAKVPNGKELLDELGIVFSYVNKPGVYQ